MTRLTTKPHGGHHHHHQHSQRAPVMCQWATSHTNHQHSIIRLALSVSNRTTKWRLLYRLYGGQDSVFANTVITNQTNCVTRQQGRERGLIESFWNGVDFGLAKPDTTNTQPTTDCFRMPTHIRLACTEPQMTTYMYINTTLIRSHSTRMFTSELGVSWLKGDTEVFKSG